MGVVLIHAVHVRTRPAGMEQPVAHLRAAMMAVSAVAASVSVTVQRDNFFRRSGTDRLRLIIRPRRAAADGQRQQNRQCQASCFPSHETHLILPSEIRRPVSSSAC